MEIAANQMGSGLLLNCFFDVGLLRLNGGRCELS